MTTNLPQKVSVSAAQRRLRMRLNQQVRGEPLLPATTPAEPSAGVYSAVYLTYATHSTLAAWAAQVLNPALPATAEPTKPHDYHTTIVYSRQPFEYLGHGVFEPFEADAAPYRLDLFGKPDSPKVLVLCFSSSTLQRWFKNAIAAGASTDFPQYQPHITLANAVPDGFDCNALPVYAGSLAFRYEDVQPLKDD